MSIEKKKGLLGESLVDKGVITEDQLEQALSEQKRTGEFLGRIILRQFSSEESLILSAIAVNLGIKYIKRSEVKIQKEVLDRFPSKFSNHYNVMPVNIKDNTLQLAVSYPYDMHTLDDIRMLLGMKVEILLMSEKDIALLIRKHYGIGADSVEELEKDEIGQENEKKQYEDLSAGSEDKAAMIKFVNLILLHAYNDGATDIHIEPYGEELKIRYRVDGVLYNMDTPPDIKRLHPFIVSRIKIMSGLDIAEHRVPQDGRMRIKAVDKELDLRVSILPTSFGEAINIRILSGYQLLDISYLGMNKGDVGKIESLLEKPHGIILVTGPTGSGKTTTLYACLTKLNTEKNKLITIEDPIEYKIKGITQMQILPKAGFTFARGLRSMLRHDPDIMMVGEIRDLETAEIAIRVALTGHLVFSTLHTNDAPGAMTRLLDMGIEPFLLTSSLLCVIAQRLVRLICPECKTGSEITEEIRNKLGAGINRGDKIYRGKGCERCKYTGYKGRTGVYEIMHIDEDIKKLIMNKKSASEIREKAVQNGMRSLRQDGIEKVLAGLTTYEEVMRVSGQDAE